MTLNPSGGSVAEVAVRKKKIQSSKDGMIVGTQNVKPQIWGAQGRKQ